MKKLTLVLLALLTLNIYSAEFLTEEQADTILLEIDNICGDTWCEGEFNFSFDKINCDDQSESCVLEMTLFDGYQEFQEGDKTFTGSCTLTELSSYDQMIELRGRYTALVWEFYDIVSNCVTELEEEAYDVIY